MGFFLLFWLAQAQAGGFATVEQVIGKAVAKIPGDAEKKPLTKGLSLPAGVVVSTLDRSVVKISFADRSSLTVAPLTNIELSLSSAEVNMVSLLGGGIRALVSKQVEKPTEKMLVKTKTAALGIRGTEFFLHYDPNRNVTSLFMLEGKVALAKLEKESAEKALAGNGAQLVAAGSLADINEKQQLPQRSVTGKTLEIFLQNPQLFPAIKNGLFDPEAPAHKLEGLSENPEKIVSALQTAAPKEKKRKAAPRNQSEEPENNSAEPNISPGHQPPAPPFSF